MPSCKCGSTRCPHPGAPEPSPHCAISSTPPAPATPAPTSSCATRSKTTPALHRPSLYVRSPELTVDLVTQANSPAVTSAVDALLGGSASRTSAIKAGWIPLALRTVPRQRSRPVRGSGPARADILQLPYLDPLVL